ncbi:MAG: hypothetical protein K6F53_05835 [Lachnospiraceae bacterium]|nr:hypothetical protein [Lachnospiraceae bacterium]
MFCLVAAGILILLILCLYCLKLKRSTAFLRAELARKDVDSKQTVQMLQDWVRMKQSDGNIAQRLVDEGIHKVVLYGMEENGQLLLKELSQTAKASGKSNPAEGTGTDENSVRVLCAVDVRAVGIHADVEVLKPEDFDPEKAGVDAILVTEPSRFEEAKRRYADRRTEVVSLEEFMV